jgi:penicillin-binding protein 2
LGKTTDVNGKLIKQYEPVVDHEMKDVSSNTWDLVHQGMEAVIGYNSTTFSGLEISMAGKTGTAQQSAVHPDHGLFVGYAPAEAPEIAIAVRIANGYSSSYAAEIGRDIVRANFKLADKNELITGAAAELGSAIAGD